MSNTRIPTRWTNIIASKTHLHTLYQTILMLPVSILEDAFVTAVLACWIYQLFRMCDCCQRLRVGGKVVHKMSGRRGRVSAVLVISEEIDVTMPFSLETSRYWFCMCGTKNWKWRSYSDGCETHATHAHQPDMVTERRSMAAWKKKDACMKFPLIALLALTFVSVWRYRTSESFSSGEGAASRSLCASSIYGSQAVDLGGRTD